LQLIESIQKATRKAKYPDDHPDIVNGDAAMESVRHRCCCGGSGGGEQLGTPRPTGYAG